MTHLDLFSGIGGFALAADRVWENVEHIFVEYDPFCQEVLKKHWPQSAIHGDIREFVANAREQESRRVSSSQRQKISQTWDLLTGGFPCQPFSQAGRRKGTNDDRYLWPPMFEAITIFKPRWVIAENVAGLVTWSDGMVLEQVCTDLESEGYEVQPFIIPACAVGAPHRRDRIWFVAHRKSARLERRSGSEPSKPRNSRHSSGSGREWDKNWFEVATRLCRVDDELSYWVDGRGKKRNSRNPRLKALGNAIVPAVAGQIMLAIKSVDDVL